jgi:hypothetical protein
MPPLAHLSEVDIRRYIAGTGSLNTERHVRVCVFCIQRLGEASQLVVRWERRGLLGRLVRIDSSPVVEELLAEITEGQRRDAA